MITSPGADLSGPALRHTGGDGHFLLLPNPCRSRFSGVYLVFEVFLDTWHSHKENPSTLACYLVLSLDDLKLCKFISRSDLVLDADHSLDFLGTEEA